jgi:outer membrane lipoprotein
MRSLALVVAAAALLAAGCAATPFPEELTRSVNRSFSLAQIRADPRASLGARVILGGEIVATTPKAGETQIEVLARRLDSGDAPERSDSSPGRFLVRTQDFLDPAIYARGRRLTVLGTVAGFEERPIGEVPYAYPVLAAERIKLWPKEGPWVGGEYPPVPLDSPVLPYPR